MSHVTLSSFLWLGLSAGGYAREIGHSAPVTPVVVTAALEIGSRYQEPAEGSAAPTDDATSAETDSERTPHPDGTPEPGPDDDTESDQELQQGIAEAEQLLGSGAASDRQRLEPLARAVESLHQALENKRSLLEEGEDTTEADRNIAQFVQQLQATMADLSQPGTVDTPPTSTSEPSRLHEKVRTYVDLALNVFQRIQEIRAAWRGAGQQPLPDGQAEPQISTSNQGLDPVTDDQEGSLEEVTGFVTDEGVPVEGAVVTDPESGATATSDSNGQYALSAPAQDGEPLTLLVSNGDKRVTVKKDVARGGRAIADVELRSRLGANSSVRVASPIVVVRSRDRQPIATGALTGVVRDTQGKPMPRVPIVLQGLGVARTNAQGQYSFQHVPAGNHRVSILGAGTTIVTRQAQVVAGRSIALETNAAASDLTGRKTPAQRVIARGTGTELRGAVRDSQGRPVASARATLFTESGAVHATTRPDGRYRFVDVKPGSYRLQVSRVGYQASLQRVTLQQRERKVVDLSMRPTENTTLKKVLEVPRGTLVGSVTDYRTGRPLAGVSVFASRGQRAATDQGGRYMLRNLAPGRHQVSIQSNGYRPASGSVSVQAGRQARWDVRLQSSGGGSAGVGTGTLSGQVTDARTRRPLSGASVSIAGGPTVTTDQAGRYALRSVAPGQHRVSAQSNGYRPASGSVSVQGGRQARWDARLESSAGGSAGVGTGTLSGQVTDARTRRPLSGASVSVAGGPTATTDQGGRYVLRNVPPGPHRVSAQSNGYRPASGSVSVRAGGQARWDARLSSSGAVLPMGTGTLTGQITDAGTRRPLSGASVSIAGGQSAGTDQNGRYVLRNIAPGRHQVAVRRSGYQPRDGTITLVAGRAVTMDFGLAVSRGTSK